MIEDRSWTEDPGRPSVFISYAHADEAWKDELLKHLRAAFGPDAPIELWDDRRIGAGDAWLDEIESALDRASVAVLLVTADFLASKFIQRTEVPRLLERRGSEGVRLMPLLVKACPWSRTGWLASIQMRPTDAVPLTEHSSKSRALSEFAEEVAGHFDKAPSTGISKVAEVLDTPPPLPGAEPRSERRPRPKSRDRHKQEIADELDRQYRARDTLLLHGKDVSDTETRITDLKRILRHGPQLHPGEFLGDGRYQLIHPLGQGGFATVWLAEDRREDMQVAIKVLHGQFSTSEERRERLFRGARQMARLDHPHIVKVLGEPAVDDGWAYFVMEYVDGGDFRRAVLDGRLDLDQRLDALEKIAQALDDAHALGLVHRDVKPANILLTRDGVPKLTDFDLVRAGDTSGLTRTRAGMGSYLFAAPESMSDAAGAEAACDVYSLAATLVFALQGRQLGPLFLMERRAYLEELGLPEGALAALTRALAVDPQKRPGSATELCAELRAGLGLADVEEVQEDEGIEEAIEPPPPSASPKPRKRAVKRKAPADLFRTVQTKHDGEVDLWCEIPAGTGWIGSPEDEEGRFDREGPRHQLEIIRPFWMSAVPVTHAQFGAFDPEKANADRPDHPVANVSWEEANAFCRWLDEERGLKGARLPTEEEWEYACRAGTTTRYWKGATEADLATVGWYKANSGGSTHPVAEKLANPWGLYDLHGNVWERTASRWKGDYSGQAEGLSVDPADPPADLAAASPRVPRVVRGGSYWHTARWARSAFRVHWLPWNRFDDLGFRVLLPFAPSDS